MLRTSIRACLALMCAQALGYFIRFRTVDANITPENRLLLGTFGHRVKGCFGGIGQHRKDSGASNKDAKFKASQLNAQGVHAGRCCRSSDPNAVSEAAQHR